MAETPDSATETADSSRPDHDCLCPLGGVMDLLSRRYAMRLVCVVDAIDPARYGDIEETFEKVSSSTLSTNPSTRIFSLANSTRKSRRGSSTN